MPSSIDNLGRLHAIECPEQAPNHLKIQKGNGLLPRVDIKFGKKLLEIHHAIPILVLK